MRKVPFYLCFMILCLSLVSWAPSEKPKSKGVSEVKNIIFMIGDGMGVPALYVGMSVADHPLNIERCPIIGMQKTFSSDNYITDWEISILLQV